MKLCKTILFSLLVPAAALAQHSHYSGEEVRDIKALSPEEVKQYLAGAGMEHAKPAELNSFPGPMHVLELGERLGLSAAQREATRKLMDEHKAEARALGARVVEAERELESLFRSADVPEARLKAAVLRAGELQGRYRLSHLETHRRMRALLSPEQIARYDQERGYTNAASPQQHKH